MEAASSRLPPCERNRSHPFVKTPPTLNFHNGYLAAVQIMLELHYRRILPELKYQLKQVTEKMNRKKFVKQERIKIETLQKRNCTVSYGKHNWQHLERNFTEFSNSTFVEYLSCSKKKKAIYSTVRYRRVERRGRCTNLKVLRFHCSICCLAVIPFQATGTADLQQHSNYTGTTKSDKGKKKKVV